MCVDIYRTKCTGSPVMIDEEILTDSLAAISRVNVKYKLVNTLGLEYVNINLLLLRTL